MTNFPQITAGVCALVLGASPAFAQMESRPAGKTMQTEHHSTMMTTKEHTEEHTSTTPHHRVVHRRVVHHRRHLTPMHTMKKTTTETRMMTDPK